MVGTVQTRNFFVMCTLAPDLTWSPNVGGGSAPGGTSSNIISWPFFSVAVKWLNITWNGRTEAWLAASCYVLPSSSPTNASFKRLFTTINILRIISDQLSSDTRIEGNNAKVLANFWSVGTMGQGWAFYNTKQENKRIN